MSGKHSANRPPSPAPLLALLLLGGLVCFALYWLWPQQPTPGLLRDEITSQDFAQLAQWQAKTNREQVERAAQIVDPLGQLEPFLKFEKNALHVYSDADASGTSVRIDLAEQLHKVTARRSLVGKRILLDPGHFGGSWSEEEKRHRHLAGGAAVKEGDLTWATARLLQTRLQEAGAIVRLSRSAPPGKAFSVASAKGFDLDLEAAYYLADNQHKFPYDFWLGIYPSRLSQSMLAWEKQKWLKQPFHLFRRYELRRRAQLASSWKPDLTLSIHLNVLGPRRTNGIIVFVPGNFLEGELATKVARRDAFRRLIDGHMATMIHVGRNIGNNLQQHLGLPALAMAPLGKITAQKAIDIEAGVYARNLAILRRTHGPVLLIEGPCVDHPDEYSKLVDRTLLVDGVGYPARLKQFSDGIYEGLAESSF